jgi:hypothetical protein
MGAAKVEPAPLIVDAEPDPAPLAELLLLHAAAASRIPIITAPTATPRGASFRCRILIGLPPARAWLWSMAGDFSGTGREFIWG